MPMKVHGVAKRASTERTNVSVALVRGDKES